MVSNDGRPVSKDSLLDSMPFRAPPPPQAVETRGSFPTQAQSSSNRQTQATLGDLVMEESAAPLPEPNKPFAPGGPPQDRHSNASSLGALENIPFNLGESSQEPML